MADLVSPEGEETLREALVHLPSLQRALERYLRFGGLPAAVAEAASGRAEPSAETQAVLWDSILKEVGRRGASVPATQALLERIMRSLGSKVSWSRMAREMAVPLGRRGGAGNDPRTLQAYIEFLAINYFALVLYFWKQGGGASDLGKDKKVYFGDPLLATIAAERTGFARDRHADVENAVALALYRRYEPSERSAESMVAPERLHVWGTRRGGEIDFVCGRYEILYEYANKCDIGCYCSNMHTSERVPKRVWSIHSSADVGRAIAGVRVEKGLTQEQLAREVGIDRSYLAKLEAGPSQLVLERSLRALRRMGATITVSIPRDDERR